MQLDNEHRKLYNEVIKKKLPSSFVAMYENNNRLHDWYLKSFFIANTGPDIQVYSAKGSSSLQMEFTNSSNRNILLIYKDVFKINIDFIKSDDVSFISPTGFGQCLTNTFKLDDDSHICHEFEFESGTIQITCASIGYRKIIDSYWA